MYSFCIDNKFNIVCIPKMGCTQIIKYMSEYLGIFDLHKHSYTENTCAKHGNIHNCGHRLYSYNSNLPTYLVTRSIELRVLSYFKSNYYHHKKINANPTFENFVDNLHLYYKFDPHHLGMISDKIKSKRIRINHLLDLNGIESSLTNLFIKYGISYEFKKKTIINSTTKIDTENIEKMYKKKRSELTFPIDSKLFFNEEIKSKIKQFYKKDLKYYTDIIQI